MSGFFVFQPPFPVHIWPNLEWNQDSRNSPENPLHPLTRLCFLLHLQGKFSLLAFPLLLGTRLPSLWSPLFPPHAPTPTPYLSPRSGSRSAWRSPISRSGDLNEWVCSFSHWQKRLGRRGQLFTLGHKGHTFLFGQPISFIFFRWSLRHFESFPLVLAAPTNLSFFSPLLSDSRSVLATLLSLSSFPSPQSVGQKLSSLSSCTIRFQWVPGHLFFLNNSPADELFRWGALLLPFAIPCSLSPFAVGI